MRTLVLALAPVLVALATLSRPAKAAPDEPRDAATTVRGGFSKRFVAGTVTATMPKAAPTTTLPAGIKITVEIGAD